MSIRVNFDLDGTIIDSQQSVQSAMLEALHNCGRNIKNVSANGETLDKIISNLGIYDLDIQNQIKDNFKKIYDQKYCLSAVIFPGMIDLLNKLSIDGVVLNLITNKRTLPTQKIIRYFKLNSYFDNICSIDSFFECDSKAKMLEKYFNEDDENIYIGDLYQDYEAANSSGYSFYHVDWGYGTRSSNYQTFLNPDDLYKVLTCK